MTAETAQLQNQILLILKKADVCRAAIFGSYARGESAADSDLDLVVEFSKKKSLLDLVGLKLELEDLVRRKVDIITYNSIYPPLKPYIEKEQVRIL